MEYIFVITSEVIGIYDDDIDFDVLVAHKDKDRAFASLREIINGTCVNIRDDHKAMFNDEDYAEDFEDYDSFEQYWDEWVSVHFVTPVFWQYSTDEFTINIHLKEVKLCE
jgi:hypothetical protein